MKQVGVNCEEVDWTSREEAKLHKRWVCRLRIEHDDSRRWDQLPKSEQVTSAIDSLMYAKVSTRPDIFSIVRFMSRSTDVLTKGNLLGKLNSCSTLVGFLASREDL